MKRIIILSLFIILISGCITEAEPHQDNQAAFYDCMESAGHYWSNSEQECIRMEDPVGCIGMEHFERIEVTELPIGYRNTTDNFKDNFIKIDIYCTGRFYKHTGLSCEETFVEIGTEGRGISHYDIRSVSEDPIELCWEDSEGDLVVNCDERQ